MALAFPSLHVLIQFVFRNDPALAATASGSITWLGSGFAAAAALCAAKECSRRAPSYAPGWSIIAAGLTCSAFGDVAAALLLHAPVEGLDPSVTDVFHLASYPILALGLFRLPRPSSTQSDRLKLALDLLIIMVSAALVFWVMLIRPGLHLYGGNPSFAIVPTAHFVLNLALLIPLLAMLQGRAVTLPHRPVVLFTTGVLLQLVLSTLSGYRVLMGRTGDESLAGLAWMLSQIFFGLAAMAQIEDVRTTKLASRFARYGRAATSLLLPQVCVASAFVLLVLRRPAARPWDAVAVAVGAVLAAAAVRLFVVVAENRRLYETAREQIEERRRAEEALRASNEELEDRIRQRTEDLAKAMDAMRRSLRYEETLVLCATVLQREDREQEGIHMALAALRAGAKACRCYLFQNFDDPRDGLCTRQSAEVCAPGVSAQIDNEALQHVRYADGFERWREVLSAGHPLSGSVASFPEGERAILEAQGIFSLLVLPVFVGSRWYGFIGFDDTHEPRTWSEDDMRLLRAAVQTVGVWLGRRQAYAALEASEERYRTLAEAAHEMIFILNEEGRVQYANRYAAEQFGERAEALIGRPATDLFPSAVATEQRASIEQVLATGRPLYAERKTPFPPGERWLGTWLVPFTAGGRPAVMGVARDITERKQAEQALRESEARYRAMMSAMDDLVYICSGDFRIEYMNDALIRRTGRDATGEPCYKALHGRDSVCPWCVSDIVQSGRSHRWEVTSPLDGRTFSVSNTPLRHDDGRISKMAVIRDITDLRRTEEDRRKLAIRAQRVQKMASLGNLAGGMAHDLNNILAAIVGNADVALAETTANAPTVDPLREIKTSALRAADLCRQVLAYSGRGRFESEAMDLNDVIQDARRALEPSLPRRVRLHVESPPARVPIEGDRAHLRQVVLNLLTNAVEAIGDGQGEVTVSSSIRDCRRADLASPWTDDELEDGRYAVLAVSDTGCGISPDHMDRIFDPFFSTKFTGRGLGLAVVLGLVRAHRGAIQVESGPGRGSIFRIFLPLRPEGAAAPGSPQTTGNTDRQAKGSILIADDERDLRHLASAVVTRMGFRAIEAVDGREAVAKFTELAAQLSCVILDLTMPGMDGRQAFDEMTRIRADVPVFVTSGYSEQDVAAHFTGRAPAGFLLKPYQPHDLAALIRSVTETRA